MNRIKSLVLVFIALTTLNVVVSATIIHVPADQPTIQAGIDAAVDGDTVLLADGVYTGDGNRDLRINSKEITLSSENGPNNTVIDCASSDGNSFHSALGITHHAAATSVIDGIGVINAESVNGTIWIDNSSAIFRNCMIDSNATHGFVCVNGAYDQEVLFENCYVSNNHGSGFQLEGLGQRKIINCVIQNQTSSLAGGVNSRDCRLVIENSSFLDNTAGAIQTMRGTLSVKNCTFSGNRKAAISLYEAKASIESSSFIYNSNLFLTSIGGGIHASESIMEIRNSVFLKNRAYNGGAISISSTTSSADVRITNCLIAFNRADNEGGGICINSSEDTWISSISIVNSILYGNLSYRGKNVFSTNSDLSVINSIIWGNDNGIEYDTLQPEIRYSVIKNGYAGIGNLNQDPLIIGGTPFDFHLLPDSPCIDAGSTESAPDIDLDGRARPNGSGIDIGAFEFYWPSVTQVYVSMPSHSLRSGDIAYSNCTVWNPNDYVLDHHNLFVILDVFGAFYMAPSFTDFDCYPWSFPTGSTDVIVLPEFTWPSGVGSASGITWYAGLFNPEMTEIVGNVGVFDFGWSE